MTKDKNPGMPTDSKKVPIIGQKFTEKDNEIINAAVQAIVERVEPILNGIGGMVDAIDKRLQIVEEIVNGALVDVLAKRVRDELKRVEIQEWEDSIKDRRTIKREKREKK